MESRIQYVAAMGEEIGWTGVDGRAARGRANDVACVRRGAGLRDEGRMAGAIFDTGAGAKEVFDGGIAAEDGL